MLRKVICVVLSFLVIAPPLSATEKIENLVPPTHVYTGDQLNVIDKHGLPWQFNIVFRQNGKFRYETWYYGGNIKKKFGFVNGKKELESTFKFPLSDSEKVIGFEPKNFTFGTTAKHLRQMFAAPDKIFRTSAPGVKQESHPYVKKGLGASFVNRKIEAVGTIPPLKTSVAGKPMNAAMFLSDFDLDGPLSENESELAAAPKLPKEIASYALILVGLLIIEVLEALGEGDEGNFENAVLKYELAREILNELTIGGDGSALLAAMSIFALALEDAAEDSPTENPSLDYVNNLKDVKSTMEKTTNLSDNFPVTVFNDTHNTGKECGEGPIPLRVTIDNRFIGQVAPGRSITTPIARGRHTQQACGDGNFGCPGFPFNVPDTTTGHYFWVCGITSGLQNGAGHVE